MPLRHSSSVAARQESELFMGAPPAPPPRSSTMGHQAASVPHYQPYNPPTPQTGYNPQAFARPMSTMAGQGFQSLQSPSASSPHAPYNPADYREDNLQRLGSVRHSAGYSPNNYNMTSPVYSPGSQYAPTFPSPQIPQQPYSSSRSSLYGPPRPTVQTNSFTSDHGAPPPPTRLAQYSSSPPVPPYSSAHPLPPTPTPPAPPPHSPRRLQSQRAQPQGDYFAQNDRYTTSGAEVPLSSQALMDQVENDIMNLAAGTGASPRIHLEPSDDERWPYESNSGGEGRNGNLTNGHLTPDAAYDAVNSSDLEADAGLAALRMAEEEEAADEARRRSGSAGLHTRYNSYSSQQHVQHAAYNDSGESDGPPVDLGLFGGGFDAHMSYGGAPEQLTVERHPSSGSGMESRSHVASSQGSMRRSHASDMEPYEYDDNIHPFPPFASAARVDAYGTGGLEEPGERDRRLSYDEGDESGFYDEGGVPDMFFHPGMSNQRPLPPPPAGEQADFSGGLAPYPTEFQNGSQIPFPRYPQAPEHYIPASAASPNVPRSTSLLSHSTTQQAIPLPRSRTDAEERERRWKQQQARRSVYLNDSDSATPASASAVALDLPTLPTAKRYNPSKLGTNDFKKCTEPWAFSGIVSWLKAMTEGEQDLKEHGLVEGLVALFTNKVPTMNIADAETLAAKLVTQMRDEGVLVQEEEWLKFKPETITGVIYQLTGAGCYAPKLHNYSMPGRCYSHHCQRTLKKLDLNSQPALKPSDDWQTFFNMKKEDVEGVSNKEVERQNILHEIVQKEDKFLDDLDVLRVLYRDALAAANPPLITPNRLPGFLKDVFGKADAVKKANEDYLLPQLKYRQREQGPWVIGFSDIFREWIRKAKAAYIAYASAFPNANFRIRKEAEKNMLFKGFLEKVRSNALSNKLGWDTYLKVPITKLQQYGLLLESVLKKSTVDNDERRNLAIAIEEIKAVTHECDSRVAEMSRKVDLKDLQSKLKLRPGMERVELNLDHLGRELIFKGDLQRTGANRFTWLETHALLFDHFLVLAKTVQGRDKDGMRMDMYDVSRMPIPMDLLVLESRDDDAVVKSMKGIAAVTVVQKAAAPDTSATRLSRAQSNQSVSPVPGQLQHTNTSTSLASLATNGSSKTTVTTTVLSDQSSKDDKIMYPFRIKHLGKEVYTLFAPSSQNREDWCDRIVEAKTRHAASLFRQNAEPFRLRVLADCAFGYESGAQSAGKSIVITGTPLDRAVREVEERYRSAGRPTPVCRARVNCATNFSQPDGKEMCAVGTDFGVYVSGVDDPRSWSRVIPTSKVTQLAVLEEFGLFLLIADRSLIAYHLDVVCPAGGGPPNSSSTRGAPQKLSGSKDVGFFTTGKMKDRMLVLYKKKESLSSTFKVLEPVFQKSTEKKSRFPPLRSGRTEFFREYDEFYIPTECMGLNLFHSSLAVSTLKGFEVLTLDKKQPWSVPDLKQSHVATIAARLQGQMPLGMFRLSEQEFLCVYEECAVYVNKHGDISRSVIMEFVGRARTAALYGAYVLLFDSEFVEIRNAQNGRLRQVISGRDVRCLDDGLNGSGTWGANTGEGGAKRRVKLAMQHPENEKSQLVVELVLNEGLKE
ncbi:hypothetical protein NA57DRAFT_29566 [Rhizodiscina lignyota]|uniref:Rho1 guanine nucleotide exchange factor 3 n=1 Tax=Rhizodiscina lignyota TaxID=1504668 RepID=A0A9P4IT33_9PEZI|nr:hypothetical protein NA57DRAFT_29566 [Rhizodiscina lignyota]